MKKSKLSAHCIEKKIKDGVPNSLVTGTVSATKNAHQDEQKEQKRG
jgi:hypothetical protein